MLLLRTSGENRQKSFHLSTLDEEKPSYDSTTVVACAHPIIVSMHVLHRTRQIQICKAHAGYSTARKVPQKQRPDATQHVPALKVILHKLSKTVTLVEASTTCSRQSKKGAQAYANRLKWV